MIRLDAVSFGYRGSAPLLTDVTLELPSASFTTVVGPSGCGKTTLLLLMAGLIAPDRGRATCEAESPAVILQDYGLLPWFTVAANVAIAVRLRGGQKSRVAEALEVVGIAHLGNRYPAELSGGQRQRVAIARALAADAHCLLMDEPFSALDPLTREDMQELTLSLWRDRQFTTVLITHSIEEAVYMGQRVLVLPQFGQVACPVTGTAAWRESPGFAACVSQARTLLRGAKGVPGGGGTVA